MLGVIAYSKKPEHLQLVEAFAGHASPKVVAAAREAIQQTKALQDRLDG